MVVLGNPPYSGHSANTGAWIAGLLRGIDSTTGQKTGNYFEVDGLSLCERNPKWLNDDYVKFIRFAQWRIEQTGYGILAFVTNHGYLDNPTFRGMRQSLMQSFDDIYLLDLHGNSKKKEKALDGGKDENVFNIQQGVAIGLFVKRGKSQEKLAQVYHAELYGTRESKYAELAENDLNTTKWKTLQPQTPFYLFAFQDERVRAEYEKGWKITEVMPINVSGFLTHRDNFAIDFEQEKLRNRISEMYNTELKDEEFAQRYDLKDNRDWKLGIARRQLREDSRWQEKLIQCAYRPFDTRWGYFSEVAMDYPRRALKENVAGKENLSIGVGRQGIAVQDTIWSLLTCSISPIDANIFRRGGVNIFPLYLYPSGKNYLFDNDYLSTAPSGRQPNLAPEFIAKLSARLKLTFLPDVCGDMNKSFGPEDVLHYAYAVFHSPSYRIRYAEFLKIDFPKLPLTSNIILFRNLCTLGKELMELHLMKKQPKLQTRYPVAGNDMTENVRYTNPTDSIRGRVWINKMQYFDNVPPEVWNYHIGGYQVCHKWLKDRKRRQLSYDDMTHYQGIIAVLARTIELQVEIDEAIGEWPIQ